MEKSLTEKIFIGFVSGIIFGLLIGIISIPSFYEDSIILFLSFGGDVFLKLIKMLVVPIVFFSLINGVANLQNISSLGRIGIKSIIIYITTTFLAISISLFFANFWTILILLFSLAIIETLAIIFPLAFKWEV